jgi:hypothetical protein
MKSLSEIKEICKFNNRICPKPQKWNVLWEMLNNRKRIGQSWQPSPPLILAAWHHTTDNEKHERLMYHLTWAEEQNQLDDIFEYLSSLDEFDWHHEDE